MRASLLSATSVLALLLLDAAEAIAGPSLSLMQQNISLGGTPDDAASVEPGPDPWSSGGGADAAINVAADRRFGLTITPGLATRAITPAADGEHATFDPNATAAAGMESISTSGMLSLSRTPAGRRRTVEPGHSVFAGFGGAITPEDSPQEVSANSASFAYTFSPAAVSAAITPDDSTDTDDGRESAAPPPGAADAAPKPPPTSAAFADPRNTSATTLGYSYTPGKTRPAALPPPSRPISGSPVAISLPRSVANPRTGNPASSMPYGKTGGTRGGVMPPPGAHAAADAPKTDASRTRGAATVDWTLQDLANASTGGDPRLANLTIEDYLIAAGPLGGAASLPVGSGVAIDDKLTIPMTVVATGVGELASNLTIFTSEGTGMNGVGESYVYFSGPPAVVAPATSSSAPKLASLAVLGVGLVGLAIILRRRQAE